MWVSQCEFCEFCGCDIERGAILCEKCASADESTAWEAVDWLIVSKLSGAKSTRRQERRMRRWLEDRGKAIRATPCFCDGCVRYAHAMSSPATFWWGEKHLTAAPKPSRNE
jgi:hypothetical protein